MSRSRAGQSALTRQGRFHPPPPIWFFTCSFRRVVGFDADIGVESGVLWGTVVIVGGREPDFPH